MERRLASTAARLGPGATPGELARTAGVSASTARRYRRRAVPLEPYTVYPRQSDGGASDLELSWQVAPPPGNYVGVVRREDGSLAPVEVAVGDPEDVGRERIVHLGLRGPRLAPGAGLVLVGWVR